MSFEYEWTRENLKKELISRRYNVNLVYFLLGIGLYIFFLYDAIKSELFDRLIIVIGGCFFAFFLAIFLWIITKIYVIISLRKNDKNTNKAYGTYHVQLDDEQVSVSINDQKIEYKYEDIIKLKKRRHSFFIRTKDDKLGLLFKESVIGKDNYGRILSFIQDKVSC